MFQILNNNTKTQRPEKHPGAFLRLTLQVWYTVCNVRLSYITSYEG